MSALVPGKLLQARMMSVVTAQVSSPLRGTRTDTQLQMPMVIFERPVLSLYNPRKYYFYSTVHTFIITLVIIQCLHVIGVRRFNL